MRKSYRDGDWELFKKLLPDDNYYDDVVAVLNGQTIDISTNQGGSMVAENFLLAYPPSFLVEKKMTKKQKQKKEKIVMALKKKKWHRFLKQMKTGNKVKK